jgi:hypothetical protein
VPVWLAAIASVLVALLAAGCGGSSPETDGVRTGTVQTPAAIGAEIATCRTDSAEAAGLRTTGASCGRAQAAMRAWQRARSCSLPTGASRGACSIRPYRCVATATDRGTAVSCSRQGESIAFVAKRR